MPDRVPPASKAEIKMQPRKKRLAAALRENIARRKQQAASRAQGAADGASEG